MVSEVWIDKTQLGMVRCGSFWQAWFGEVGCGEVGCGQAGKVRRGTAGFGVVRQVRCDQARRGMVGCT
jgi:hypothetical protein